MNSDSLKVPGKIFKAISIFLVIIFSILVCLGHYGPKLITNDKCYQYLGCNAGFFGYDAVEHFLFGIIVVMLIVWVMRKFKSLSMFQSSFWKNFLMIITIVTFISFCWEIAEFSHDQYRSKILHENIISPNIMDQPSNSDTMGDITFAILGSVLSACAIRFIIKKE